MIRKFINPAYTAGEPDDTGNGNSTGENVKAGQESDQNATGKQPEKGFFDKVKKALQEWSNNDQKEQEEDDTTP